MAAVTPDPTSPAGVVPLPRVTIRFCTQCKWLLRAAYYAQELLSTFSTSLGEVALQPGTGGVFVVEISTTITTTTTTNAPPIPPPPGPDGAQHQNQNQHQHQHPSAIGHPVVVVLLWDRKTDGGFPETKELKRRVRDVIEPGRHLGHVDRHGRRGDPRSGLGPAASNGEEAAGEAGRQVAEPAARQMGGRGGSGDGGGEGCEDCDFAGSVRRVLAPLQYYRINPAHEPLQISRGDYWLISPSSPMCNNGSCHAVGGTAIRPWW
ncbi:hypothetical protein P8C59_006585 [Phyllachora maydis]|uniref:Uncharacterized protein n=1 Tax=Phyllachora maydis TaxID=1825666 RepID=A0AAD9I6L8_9PEZI|nr:hypothetical protein P8C59_006585 [Phyllachora maydis]